MRVVEADNVFSALAAVALDFDQFFWVDVIAIVCGISTRVASSGNGRDGFCVVIHLAEEHSAAFVGIGFFPVLAESFIKLARNF